MAQSFANVRLGAAALFFAAGLAGACGGDDSGGKDDPKTDSGTPVVKNDAGGVDAATPPPVDAGRDATTSTSDAGDAGTDELAAAIDPAGIHVSTRRADLVLPAACQQAAACDLLQNGVTAASCTTGARAEYDHAVEVSAPDACLDADLDFYGCIAVPGCDNDCMDLDDAFHAACQDFIVEDDAGVEQGDGG